MEILIIVIGIVLIIALEIIFNLNKKRIPDKLTQLLLEHRFDEFDALMDKKTTKLFVKAFNYYYLKLNKSIIVKNNKDAQDCFEKLVQMKTNNAQRKSVLFKKFYFYLSLNDKQKAKEAYDNYKELADDDLSDIDIMYDTFILGKATYLDKTLVAYNKAPKEKLPDLDLLLSEMYKNKNDNKNADKYTKLAQTHLNDLNNN